MISLRNIIEAMAYPCGLSTISLGLTIRLSGYGRILLSDNEPSTVMILAL